MPVLTDGNLQIDYSDDGSGEPVILIHSSVSGNRQWRTLIEDLRDQYRVIAINLFGYGETSSWPPTAPQSLYAQAQLVIALCRTIDGPVGLVGHSFGGSVALKAAELLGDKTRKLILLEPNPFFLLRQHGHTEAYLESRALRDHVKSFGALGDWLKVAERFADYWLGDGAWSDMPEKRRLAFAQSCTPNFHEWDAVMDEESTVEQLRAISAPTLVVSDPETRRPIAEIVAILLDELPCWTFRHYEHGGHMAPLTRPDVVNPIVREFLANG